MPSAKRVCSYSGLSIRLCLSNCNPLSQDSGFAFLQYQMARMFNLSPHSSSLHIFGTEILMSSLLETIIDGDNTKVYWPQMLALCLYTQFLLVSPSDDCDSKLLHILDQVEARSNPFPLILAETITGLDNFIETIWYSKSPIPLEVSFPRSNFHSLFHYHFGPFINPCMHGFIKS